MAEKFVIGQRLPTVEAVAKVTGQAAYTDDHAFPGLLHGKILRSPHAHARILHIDTSQAARLPGVKAIITGKDTPTKKYGGGHGAVPDQQGLATDKVRYIGDEVAAVAASDEDIAEEALRLIRVEYEVLPAVFAAEEAMRPGAPILHDHAPDNISVRGAWDLGDVDRALAEADHVREDTFTTTGVQHCALEPHTCVASYDNSGRATLWASCAGPFVVRSQLATVLEMPESRIRIISPYIGGHFGAKSHLFPLYFCSILLSKAAGRPVKTTLTREEVFSTTLRRHPTKIWLRTGVTRDGTLLGTDCRLIADGGAFASHGPSVLTQMGAFLIVTYRLPNVRYRAFRLYTNNPVSGAMRGFGAVQSRYAAEAQLDLICADLGLDPVEVRLKNAIQAGDKLVNDFGITSCGLSDCIEKAAAASGWHEKRGKMPFGRGIGMGCSSFKSGHGMPLHATSGAVVKLNEDGGITLLTGVSNVGQGSDTTMGQIAAEELGILLDDVNVISGDTDVVPVHAGSYSSRGTLWGGSAVKAAAADAKRQLLDVVAEKFEVSPEDLEVGNRRIWVKGTPARAISFGEAVKASMLGHGNPIIGRGYYKDETAVVDTKTGKGNMSPAYSFGAQVAEVEVDLETGQIKIVNMVVAHDCGVTINPLSVEGQLHGSVHMGQGQALVEEMRITDDGSMLNASFLDYHMPLSLDVPPIEPIIVETDDPTLPNGAKEAGEGTTISTVPAIINAIYDAIGVMYTELPASPDKVVKALQRLERERGVLAG